MLTNVCHFAESNGSDSQALLNLAIKVTPALVVIFHKRGQVLNLALEPDH